MSDYRLIFLLNCMVKIFSKILASRLAPRLEEVVGDYQMDFIKGRNIMDSVFITQEVIHQMKKQKEGFILKIDCEKAYDRVNWACLKEVLKSRNFGPKLIQWITDLLESGMTCISSEEGVERERLNVGELSDKGTLYLRFCSYW